MARVTVLAQVLVQGVTGRNDTHPVSWPLGEGQQRKRHHLSVILFHKDLIKPWQGQYLLHAASLFLWMDTVECQSGFRGSWSSWGRGSIENAVKFLLGVAFGAECLSGESGTLVHSGFAHQKRDSEVAFHIHFLLFPASFFFPFKKERLWRTVVSAVTQIHGGFEL